MYAFRGSDFPLDITTVIDILIYDNVMKPTTFLVVGYT